MKALQRIKTLLIWLLLMIFAVVILVVFVPPAFIVGIVGKFWRTKIGNGLDEFSTDLKNTSITLDVLGNITVFNWLWFLFKRKSGYKFGKLNETISYVLWRNYTAETLTGFGLLLYKMIDSFDRGHFKIFEHDGKLITIN